MSRQASGIFLLFTFDFHSNRVIHTSTAGNGLTLIFFLFDETERKKKKKNGSWEGVKRRWGREEERRERRREERRREEGMKESCLLSHRAELSNGNWLLRRQPHSASHAECYICYGAFYGKLLHNAVSLRPEPWSGAELRWCNILPYQREGERGREEERQRLFVSNHTTLMCPYCLAHHRPPFQGSKGPSMFVAAFQSFKQQIKVM